jgi:hypothetical protein
MAKQAATGEDILSLDTASKSEKESIKASYQSAPPNCEVCQHLICTFYIPFRGPYDFDLGECSRCAWNEDIVHVDGAESKFGCNWMDAITLTYASLGAFRYVLLEYNHRLFHIGRGRPTINPWSSLHAQSEV